MINNGNRSPIQFVNRTSDWQLTKSEDCSRSSTCLFMSIITYWIGWHEILLPMNHKYNKMCNILGISKIITQDIWEFLLAVKNETIQGHVCDGLYCPIVLKSGQLTAVRFENFFIVMMKAVSYWNLNCFFSDSGRVVRADIMTESSGRSKGCGTVLFETSEDAAHAICILFMSWN